MGELLNNREHRQKLLKEMILELHQGASVDSLKERFKNLLEHVGATEIAEMEQKLIEEGLPAEEIKRLCDVHTAVFKDTLDAQKTPDTAQGHPIHTFRAENKAMKGIIAEIRLIVNQIAKAETGEVITSLVTAWRQKHQSLLTIEKHFSRKENILFPYLEKNGITGPPTVMWALHDDIRKDLKKITAVIEEAGDRAEVRLTRAVADLVIPTVNTIEELFYKEENILFPMCLDTLSPDEWQEIYNQSADIGYALIDPPPKWTAGGSKPAEYEKLVSGSVKLDTGVLTTRELNCMIKSLPLDITFVDKDDIVRYFSAGSERIFERTPAIIGRKVQLCHPPDSVHVVEKIVNDFKNNRRSSADFWIQMNEMFVYIRYLPVRDENGEYLGVVELTQNIKDIRALHGEKRILDEE